MDWFLYDNGFRHKRVNYCCIVTLQGKPNYRTDTDNEVVVLRDNYLKADNFYTKMTVLC